MQNNSNLVIAIVVILLILGGVAFMLDSKRDEDKSKLQQGDSLNPADSSNVAYNNYTQDGVDETPDSELTAQAAETPAEQKPAPQAPRLTYDQALAAYGSGGNNYRYQIAANCQANPSALTIKKGQKFMLDNRDGVAHTIKFGSQTFRLNKYAFVVVTARQNGDFAIQCDGVDRARMLVQP